MHSPSWSHRVERIQPFYVMEILSRAARRPPDRGSLVNLVVGEPDFPTPAPIVQAAQAALLENRIHYTSALGMPELRAGIARDYLERDQISVQPEQVVVTAGASAGLLLALAAVIDPGDEVLIPDPGYPCNRAFVEALGGVPKALPLLAAHGYQPTAEDVLKAWGPKTRAVLLASPSNPTGTVISEAQAAGVLEAVRAKGGWLLADEIYLRLVFSGVHRSLLQFAQGAHDCLISINSFSKTFAMTGWRLGWLVAPTALIPALERLSQNLFISPPVLSQKAALAAFTSETRAIVDGYRAAYAEQASYLVPALESVGFRVPARPDGAFYVYCDVSAHTQDSSRFCEQLCDDLGVLMAPGRDFTADQPERMVRVSFPKPVAVLSEGVARLRGHFFGRKA
ncbi:MAG: hypothetical protein RLY30_1226 [Pseudomonadota bacterium]